MAQVSSKHLGKSKYKGVYIIDQNQTIQYKAYMTINGKINISINWKADNSLKR